MSTVTTAADSVREARREAFVAAARDSFFAHGYAATTMSSIAAKVGGSKTTLWTYFPSKEDLFAAVVDDIVDQYGNAISIAIPPDADLETMLRIFGRAMMATILSEPVMAVHRLVIGEADRFPELAEMFYARGPKRGKERLAAVLADAMARGTVRSGDPMVAARHFAGMCQSGCFQQVLIGLDRTVDQAAVEADVDAAVTTFLRAWAV